MSDLSNNKKKITLDSCPTVYVAGTIRGERRCFGVNNQNLLLVQFGETPAGVPLYVANLDPDPWYSFSLESGPIGSTVETETYGGVDFLVERWKKNTDIILSIKQIINKFTNDNLFIRHKECTNFKIFAEDNVVVILEFDSKFDDNGAITSSRCTGIHIYDDSKKWSKLYLFHIDDKTMVDMVTVNVLGEERHLLISKEISEDKEEIIKQVYDVKTGKLIGFSDHPYRCEQCDTCFKIWYHNFQDGSNTITEVHDLASGKTYNAFDCSGRNYYITDVSTQESKMGFIIFSSTEDDKVDKVLAPETTAPISFYSTDAKLTIENGIVCARNKINNHLMACLYRCLSSGNTPYYL